MWHSHCNTLQHTATHCNTLQHNTRQHTTTHKSHRVSRIDCETLTATHRNTLQHDTQQHTATHSNTQQHTATHCNTLQVNIIARSRLRAIKWVKFNVTLSATHCNTLQHTATHCNTLQVDPKDAVQFILWLQNNVCAGERAVGRTAVISKKGSLKS